MKIVFVCTGNTCRSPMAKYIAEDYLKKNGIEYEISSAGLAVFSPEKATENAIKAMQELNIDITNHISTPFTKALADNADYIVPMTSSHKIALLNKGVDAKKIIDFNEQVYDPYGQDINIYRECADQLAKLIESLMVELNESKNT